MDPLKGLRRGNWQFREGNTARSCGTGGRGTMRTIGGPICTVFREHGHPIRSVTENRVGPADLPRRQGLRPKWDSGTSQMTRPGWIIIVSEAMKPGEGVFSR